MRSGRTRVGAWSLCGLAVVAPPGAADRAVASTGAPTPFVQPHLDIGGVPAPTVGVPVRVSPGVWAGDVQTFGFRWETCAPGTTICAAVDGADGQVYVPTTRDVGRVVRARVEAQGSDLSRAVAVTATSPPVVAGGATSPPVSDAPAAPGPPTPAMTGGDGRVMERGTASGGGVPTGLQRVVTRTYGAAIEFRGRLSPTDSRTTSGLVTIRDPSGVAAGSGPSTDDGRFALSVPATRPGTWAVEGPGGRTTVRVVVRPVVRVAGATATVRAPGVVQVRGQIAPGARGKVVELQYLDPRRGWRLWRQARTGVSGRFRIGRGLARNPAVPRYLLRVRVVVPSDRGWPFAPAASSPIVVRVS